jgi:hypothetical protein
MSEDLVEIVNHAADLGVGQSEIGEVGDIPHLFFGDLHALAFLRADR